MERARFVVLKRPFLSSHSPSKNSFFVYLIYFPSKDKQPCGAHTTQRQMKSLEWKHV